MKNNIFNQHLMDKYATDKDFRLKPSKYDIIKNHIVKLEKGDLKAERENYLYFYEEILKSILGYKKSNFDFESTGKTGRKKLHLKK